jgi:hypothetical protein
MNYQHIEEQHLLSSNRLDISSLEGGITSRHDPFPVSRCQTAVFSRRRYDFAWSNPSGRVRESESYLFGCNLTRQICAWKAKEIDKITNDDKHVYTCEQNE